MVKTPVSLQNNPKNLAILNNLTLIATNSNIAELQTADITNPNTPILKGVFNAEGNSDAMGIAGFEAYRKNWSESAVIPRYLTLMTEATRRRTPNGARRIEADEAPTAAWAG